MRIVKRGFLASLFATALIVSLSIVPVHSRIPVEAEDQDTGSHGSWAWAYIYALYDPVRGSYSGIQHDHYYTFGGPSYQWRVELRDSSDQYHPYSDTVVFYSSDNGAHWYIDAWASIVL